MKNKIIKSSGFTLLEILLVVGIIAILAGIVIIAINPGRQLARVRDTERRVDIVELNKALTQYYIDEGHFPSTLPSGEVNGICNTGDSATSTGFECEGLADLSLLVPKYLPAIPTDPTGVGYEVGRNSSGKIVLAAPLTELETEIVIGTRDPVDVCSHVATDPDCWSISYYGLTWGPIEVVTAVVGTTTGATNTVILAGLEDEYPAADYCYRLNEDGHNDWYLPAINQLTAGLEEYKTQYNLGNTTWGGFTNDNIYWSSTEYSARTARFAFYGTYYNIIVSYNANKDYSEDKFIRCLR